ncbi:hypothetical protein FRX31_011804, partial [Thalictrum thalictroides]
LGALSVLESQLHSPPKDHSGSGQPYILWETRMVMLESLEMLLGLKRACVLDESLHFSLSYTLALLLLICFFDIYYVTEGLKKLFLLPSSQIATSEKGFCSKSCNLQARV